MIVADFALYQCIFSFYNARQSFPPFVAMEVNATVIDSTAFQSVEPHLLEGMCGRCKRCCEGCLKNWAAPFEIQI
jgi:hypothetical protein